MVYSYVGARAGGEMSCRRGGWDMGTAMAMGIGMGVKRRGGRVDGGYSSKGGGTETGMFVEDGGHLVGRELELVSRVNGFNPCPCLSFCRPISLADF